MRNSTVILLAMLLSLSSGAFHVAIARTWLDTDWSHRAKLTVDDQRLPSTGTLQEFTALVRMDQTNLSAVFDVAKPDGTDLVFTGGDGVTVLEHELVSYNSVARTGEVWFKAPQLSSSSNVFFMYFGNLDTTVTPGGSLAWSGDHLAVYHFAEDPAGGTARDSGPGDGDNSAIAGSGSTWNESDLVSGQVGDAWYFDGTDDWLFAESISSPDSSFTVSAWFANVDNATHSMLAMNPESEFWGVFFRRSTASPNASLGSENGEVVWDPDINDASMHHYVWALDAESDTARFYMDGVEQPVIFRWPPSGNGQKLYTGLPIQGRVGIASEVFGATSDRTQGVVDEYRLVEGARSAGWIATEFKNQSDPVGFFEYKIELEDPVTAVGDLVPGPSAGQIRVWPNPVRGMASIDVALDSPRVEVNVYDVAGRLVRNLGSRSGTDGLLRLQWDGRDFSGRPVSRGVYYVRATGGRSDVGTKFLLVK